MMAPFCGDFVFVSALTLVFATFLVFYTCEAQRQSAAEKGFPSAQDDSGEQTYFGHNPSMDVLNLLDGVDLSHARDQDVSGYDWSHLARKERVKSAKQHSQSGRLVCRENCSPDRRVSVDDPDAQDHRTAADGVNNFNQAGLDFLDLLKGSSKIERMSTGSVETLSEADRQFSIRQSEVVDRKSCSFFPPNPTEDQPTSNRPTPPPKDEISSTESDATTGDTDQTPSPTSPPAGTGETPLTTHLDLLPRTTRQSDCSQFPDQSACADHTSMDPGPRRQIPSTVQSDQIALPTRQSEPRSGSSPATRQPSCRGKRGRARTRSFRRSSTRAVRSFSLSDSRESRKSFNSRS